RRAADESVEALCPQQWPHRLVGLLRFPRLRRLDLGALGPDPAPLSRIAGLLKQLAEASSPPLTSTTTATRSPSQRLQVPAPGGGGGGGGGERGLMHQAPHPQRQVRDGESREGANVSACIPGEQLQHRQQRQGVPPALRPGPAGWGLEGVRLTLQHLTLSKECLVVAGRLMYDIIGSGVSGAQAVLTMPVGLGELTALRSLAIVRAAPAVSNAASSRAMSYSSGYHTWRPMLPEAWREAVAQARTRALNELEY
ncbi:hypothetical protein VaNZ11_005141, partial [Volvox africanus]